uniref:PH domain-containing protein n=1 Tax=Marmota marmota marmota TaxID=9994 RepID=A0A8C5ZQ92_MARMA
PQPDLLNFKKGWMSILDEPGEWKKHWFVLTDSSLKYYRDSTAEEADELDGEIDLRSCTDVTEYAVQRNYGFQIHTKDAVYTLSAMTSGIRRNWIEALRKTVRPTSAPDVTKPCQEPGSPSPIEGAASCTCWWNAVSWPGVAAGAAGKCSFWLGDSVPTYTVEEENCQSLKSPKFFTPSVETTGTPLLLHQSRGDRRGPPSDSHEALEKEVQSLRAQLEAWRLRGETPQNARKSQEDGHVPPGYISQEACERSLAEMESSHQQVMEQLQRHHERELQRLQQEKEWLLAEETAATASAIEAMKKAYQEELSRELSKTRSLQQGPDGLRKQHQSDVEALKRELQVLSERYSQKCLEIGALTRQAEEREDTLRRCQQEGQELLRHNQELHTRLSEEIDRLRSFIASQGTGNSCGRPERSSCELEVLLRVKENELQYLKKEVQCLRDELQGMQKDKRFTSGKYQDVYVELNHIKTRSEREIEQLKEHLRLAMAALQEKESTRNSLAQ